MTQEKIPFSHCDLEQQYTLVSYKDDSIASKLLTMGLLPGASLMLIRKSLFGRTFYIQNEGDFLALRKEEAASIMVIKS